MPTISNEIFQVSIRNLSPSDLKPYYKDKIVQSVFYFENAVKSDYFIRTVLQFNNSENGFNQRYNLGLNNKGIYLKIINAVEENGNVERYVADLNLNLITGKHPDGRTIGFVENNSKIIHTYSNFIESLSKSKLSAHFAHEWCHLLGFKHPIDTGTNAIYLARTVPYAVENIVRTYLDERFQELLII